VVSIHNYKTRPMFWARFSMLWLCRPYPDLWGGLRRLHGLNSWSGTGSAVAAGWGSTPGTTSSRPIQIYEINLRSARRGGRVVGQNPTRRPTAWVSFSGYVQARAGDDDMCWIGDIVGQNAAVSTRISATAQIGMVNAEEKIVCAACGFGSVAGARAVAELSSGRWPRMLVTANGRLCNGCGSCHSCANDWYLVQYSSGGCAGCAAGVSYYVNVP